MEANITPAGTDVENDLEAAVRDAVLMLDSVRPTRARVNVHVENGHVTLTGIVQSPMAAVEVERAALSVPGITGMTNQVLDDGTITRHIAEALAKDPRTRDIPPGYQITSVFGHVTLAGYFSGEQAQAVIGVAQGLPGVREVSVKSL